MSKRLNHLILSILVLVTVVSFSSCGHITKARAAILDVPESYELEQVVVLSRHNIRSPLSGPDSDIGRMTAHKWFEWTSPASCLSVKGGELEVLMGRYFKEYLDSNKLIDENILPQENAVRFYANSMERTVSTAQHFITGFMPDRGLEVEYHFELNTMDPVFNPVFTYCDDEFREKAYSAMDEMSGTGHVLTIAEKLKENFSTLETVLDFKNSEYAKAAGVEKLPLDDTVVTLELGEEPTMTGGLKKALRASDALTLQYYEEPDDRRAGFGKALTGREWKEIGEIVDVYQNILFSPYPVAVNVAHPLLVEIEGELENPDRKFTYLCGHDCNIGAVLASLEAEEYRAQDAITELLPIGGKLTFEKLKGSDGREYIKILLIYQDVSQLRKSSELNGKNPPAVTQLYLKGLEKNSDGLYLLSDFIARMDKAIGAYNIY